MNIFEKRNQLAEINAEWYNYKNNLYPGFVTSSREESVPEDIPVFSFHNISSEDLIQKLNYLVTNGYDTVNSDEYIYLNGKSNGNRLVMLTFDDGLLSLWTVVFPLLRAYQMKAVAFVLPGEIDQMELSETDPEQPERDSLLCSWRQLEAMTEVVDIQSHSLYHWLIFDSSRVSCFFTPQIRSNFQKIDWPIPHRLGKDRPQRDIGLGAPIYTTNSRLSGSLRVFESEEVAGALTSWVDKKGGEDFFASRNWESELKREYTRLAGEAALETETPDQRLKSVTNCFNSSKEILDNRLGKEVRGFCFPFGIGSPEAEKMALEAGYSAVYYGVRPSYDESEAVPLDGLRRVTRLKDDYLYRLPGNGRKSLMRILYEKAERRIANLLYGKGKIR